MLILFHEEYVENVVELLSVAVERTRSPKIYWRVLCEIIKLIDTDVAQPAGFYFVLQKLIYQQREEFVRSEHLSQLARSLLRELVSDQLDFELD
jgi:hypothetical protein